MEHIVYEFAGFRLDPRQRALWNSRGQAVPLTPRVFDTLLVLVQRPGELIEKSFLLNAVWRGVVAQNSLDQNISLLRRALRGKGATQELIVTERGRGYRLVVPVRRRNESETAVQVDSHDRVPDVSDREAQELYSQARALVVRPSPANFSGALELLNGAIERNPQFAAAMAERALLRAVFAAMDVPMENAVPLAEQEARHALALDGGLGRAHQALAYALIARGAWLEARQHFDAARRLEPGPEAAISRVWQLSQSLGYLRLSLQEASEVERQVPFHPLGAIGMTVACAYLGLNEQSSQCAARAAALGWPTAQAPLPDVRFLLAVRARRFDEAARHAREGLRSSMVDAGGNRAVDLVCTALHDPAKRVTAASTLMRVIRTTGVPSLGQMHLKRVLPWLVMLGAVDDAFKLLQDGLDHLATLGTIGTAWGILWIPEMAPFRRDARFRDAIARFRFAEYWREYGWPDGHAALAGPGA